MADLTFFFFEQEGQEGSAEIFKPQSASKNLKMVTYYRSADCEFEAKYTNPEAVCGRVRYKSGERKEEKVIDALTLLCPIIKNSEIAKFQIKGIVPAADNTPSKVSRNPLCHNPNF